jgi:hypothetical protein
MKTLCRATMVTVLLLLSIHIMQAQTPTVKIDQVEFMQNFIGSWKAEAGKDTIIVFDVFPFGKGSERELTVSTKGKVISSAKMLFGYDEEKDKIIEAVIYKSSPNLMINVWWATSLNTSDGVQIKDISDPENAAFRMKSELKSPDSFTLTHILNNKVVGEWTFVRQIK